MAASRVEALEGIARGMALDLLEALSEVDSVGEVVVSASDRNDLVCIKYMAMDGMCRTVFNHFLIGDEVPREGEAR